MDLHEAQNLAIVEMDKWGLRNKGWTFGFNNNKRRLGVCKYRYMQILLSRTYVIHNDEYEVKDTIRHKIAHALAGVGVGHKRLWKLWAMKVGCNNRAAARGGNINMPKGKWTITCQVCGSSSERHRYGRVIATNAKGYHCRLCGRKSVDKLVVTRNF